MPETKTCARKTATMTLTTVHRGHLALALDGDPSVTQGIVANTEMIAPGGSLRLDGESVGELVRWIGHDAVIFPGNSGGPLVNEAGEVIGLIYAQGQYGITEDGYNLAIPVEFIVGELSRVLPSEHPGLRVLLDALVE